MAARNNKALGRGINALFQEKKNDAPKETEGGERNYDFYGSLMKRYVQAGSNDPAMASMLEEIRQHLNISPEDHLQLMNTLKRREEARLDRTGKDDWTRAHGELKSELGRMFEDHKIQSLKEFPAIEGDVPGTPSEEPIALMERNPTIVRDRGSDVISVPPSTVDERRIASMLGEDPQKVGPGAQSPAAASPMSSAQKAAEQETPSSLELRTLMEDGRFAEALDMVQSMIEEDPYSISLLNEKGVILYNLERSDEAIQTFDRGLAIEPDSAELNINCAIAMSAVGNLQASLDLLDKAIAKDPYNEEAWNNKAVVLSRIGKFRDALMCLDESLRLNDRSLAAWSNAGILLERMGEFGPAYECYGKVLQLDPNSDIGMKGRAYCGPRIRA